MSKILSRNAVRIVAFAIIFLSSGVAFGGNDTIPSAPQTAEEWIKRGYMANYKRNYEEAIFCFEEAIKLKPDYAKAYNILGYVYAKGERDYNKAVEYYSKAIELKPDYAEAYLHMGDAYRDWNNQYDEAVKWYKKAIELEPDDASAYYCLGTVYVIWGEQYDEAKKWYKKAAELRLVYEDGYNIIEKAYQALDEEKKKIECYKVAARVGMKDAQQWLRDNNISW